MTDTSDQERLEQAFPGIEDLDYANATEGMRDLLGQVELDVVGWRPEPGAKVFGTVKDIADSEEGEFGSYPIIVIQTPSGTLVGVHAFHTVLKNDVERKIKRGTLKIGSEIAIQYRGQGEAKGTRNAPEMYRVAVRNPE